VQFCKPVLHVAIFNQRRILRESFHILSAVYVLDVSFLRMRIDVFLLHFEQSNGRRTTGREFSASPLLKAGSERIFLAFPLAASVTRLRLKYLLVDFTTMGSCHHRRLPPFPFTVGSSRDFFYRSLYISRARKFISFKNVLRDFSVFRQLDLHLPLNLTSFEANHINFLNAHCVYL